MSNVFQADDYRWDIYRKKPLHIFSRFFHDLKCCRQRIKQGWCEKDAWDISAWFLDVMPAMLEHYQANRTGSPGSLGENYTDEQGVLVNDTCHAEWDRILDEMIRLLRDADEETCSRKNPYEAEHSVAFEAFCREYGMLGEKLNPPGTDTAGAVTMHFMHEIDEYRDIDEAYREASEKLEDYRNACKDQAFALMSKWFWSLWD